MKEWPQIEGTAFKEVLISFPMATPIGVKEAATGAVVLNPEDQYVIQPGKKSKLPSTVNNTPFIQTRTSVSGKFGHLQRVLGCVGPSSNLVVGQSVTLGARNISPLHCENHLSISLVLSREYCISLRGALLDY